jgi:uncharacterized hydrophobic protein (TIGR00271 family)
MESHTATGLGGHPLRSVLRMLNLRNDQASPDDIDDAIRSNAQAGGTNAWVLAAAIVIASVGLNVNSTAVIIGAMLISPLMGPIIGIGYGLGVHDRPLIWQSLKVLAIFAAISLGASSLYFWASPLTQAQSELLARTAPTIWDVLIAFVGGAAGMIGLTRREKTTLIPGVAIATALMPPLCTAGYGIATGQLRFFAGALYLFAINSVFIALATLTITRMLRLPARETPDEESRRKMRWVVVAAVVVTLVPSLFLAYRLVNDEVFKSRAALFIDREVKSTDEAFLLSSSIDPSKRLIALTLLGPGVTPALQKALDERLSIHGLQDAQLQLLHPSDHAAAPPANQGQDAAALASARAAAVAATETNQRQAARIAVLEAQLERERAATASLARVATEVKALLPGAAQVSVTWSSTAPDASRRAVQVTLDTTRKLSPQDSVRLLRWLRERLPEHDVQLVVGRPVRA